MKITPLKLLEKTRQLLKIKFSEKHDGGLTYLLQQNLGSRNLIVVFSGFPVMGKPPRYNYIETLKEVNENKLFILDNYGWNKAGSYYLGENGDWFLIGRICSLIEKTMNQLGIKKLITAGSSKGGQRLFYMD